MYNIPSRCLSRKCSPNGNGGHTPHLIYCASRFYATRIDRALLDQVAKDMKIASMNDWYKLTTKILLEKVGSRFVTDYQGSPFQLLSSVYPEHEWIPWKFHNAPRNFWADIKNQRKFLDYVFKQLKLNDMSDWYGVSFQNVVQLGGSRLLIQYGKSLYSLLNRVYPEYDWLPWKFSHNPHNIWSDIETQKKFLEWVAKELKIKEMSDWYKVSSTILKDLGGANLYHGSIYKLLSIVYPDYEWLPWKFDMTPRNFWKDIKNSRKFLDWAAKELNIKEMSDWYNVSVQNILELGGCTLLDQYGSSPFKLFSSVYPEYEWLPWRFSRMASQGWDSNNRKFVEMVAREMKIQSMEDWYNVSREDLKRFNGGIKLLRFYQDSFFRLLADTYPEYGWLPWKLSNKDYWAEQKYKKLFMDYVGKELKVKDMSDWYKIKAEQVIDLGGGSFIVRYHSLPKLLFIVYPDFNWKLSSFTQLSDIWTDEQCATYYVELLKKNQSERHISYLYTIIKNMNYKGNYVLTQLLREAFPKYKWTTSVSKKSQYMLKQCLNKLFPVETVDLMEEYRLIENNNLELDYFYPQYSLAFEYQGQQHYKNVSMFHKKESIDSFKNRDKSKIDTCRELGITLVEVPYWWDKKLSSLAATVYNNRPDLFEVQPQGKPIPLTPPSQTNAKNTNKTTQNVLMAATVWDNESMEPNGWYMTEKYDGMRLYWNGQEFYSRQGEKVKVPESIVSKLPTVPLDGELWTQYGLYQDAISLSRSANEAKWAKAVFWVFDSPEVAHKTLEERIEFLQQLTLPSFAKLVEFVKCEGKEHLTEFTNSILAKGGEGVMLREPGSLYIAGRSNSMRKHKPFFDTEVRVVKNQYPHGFICELSSGKTLFVKVLDEHMEDAKHIKEGAVITVKHLGVNVHGSLLYPQFYRERLDVKWSHVNKPLKS